LWLLYLVRDSASIMWRVSAVLISFIILVTSSEARFEKLAKFLENEEKLHTGKRFGLNGVQESKNDKAMKNMVVNVYDTTECGEVLSSPGYNPGNAESYVCAQKKRTCQTYDDTADGTTKTYCQNEWCVYDARYYDHCAISTKGGPIVDWANTNLSDLKESFDIEDQDCVSDGGACSQRICHLVYWSVGCSFVPKGNKGLYRTVPVNKIKFTHVTN